MGTIFMVFRLIFSPFKTIYSLMAGKKKKTNPILKPIKYALTIVISVFLFAIVIGALAEDETILVGNRKNEIYIQQVDGTLFDTDSSLKPDNPNGTVNGLNFQLINNIKTEGYVKEYLTLALNLQEGSIGSLKVYPSVARTLGVAATEQGSYVGLPILGSVLPLGSDGPRWDKSIDLTLSKATSSVLSKYGYTESFGIVSNATGNYFGGWQVNISYMDSLAKSKLNVGSTLDGLFFPDQMYAYAQVRDNKYSVVDGYFGETKISDEARDLATSILYSGSPIFKYIPGDNPSEQAKNLESIYKWTHSNFISPYMSLLNIDAFTKGSAAKFIVIMINAKLNGKISQETYNYCVNSSYQYNICQSILDTWGISSSVESFLGNALDTSLPYQGNYSGIMTNVIDGQVYYMVPESTGHYVGEEVLGLYYFGSMLKYAGVNVDPTDPNSYMNTLPQGEWKPSGDSVWMQDYIGNTSVLTEKREKILTEAYKWLGSWYVLGGWDPPVKDSNGNWINGSPKSGNGSMKGFDCSRYVQYVYQTVLGIDISRSTWSQRANENTYVINESELLPGDLVYYYGPSADWGHVSFYLGDKDGVRYYMHAPYDNKPLSITTWDGTPEYTLLEYRRVKGIE